MSGSLVSGDGRHGDPLVHDRFGQFGPQRVGSYTWAARRSSAPLFRRTYPRSLSVFFHGAVLRLDRTLDLSIAPSLTDEATSPLPLPLALASRAQTNLAEDQLRLLVILQLVLPDASLGVWVTALSDPVAFLPQLPNTTKAFGAPDALVR